LNTPRAWISLIIDAYVAIRIAQFHRKPVCRVNLNDLVVERQQNVGGSFVANQADIPPT
jgi:hypothetical protein